MQCRNVQEFCHPVYIKKNIYYDYEVTFSMNQNGFFVAISIKRHTYVPVIKNVAEQHRKSINILKKCFKKRKAKK